METAQKKGIFIAVEGIDGSGKSTQLRLLAERIQALNLRCHVTREPTDGPIGSLIRQILTGRVKADNRTVAALYAADRIDHLTNETDGLLQKIDSGMHVVSDRYYFSSYAYHSVDVDMEWVIQANAVSAGLLRPAVTVFLDVPVEDALERMSRGRDHVELFEREERLRQVRTLYFQAFERLKDEEKTVVIDGRGTEEEVFARLWAVVSPLLRG